MPILDWLLNPTGLTAHGFCLSWAPGLIGLHVVSDVIIGLAYFSIPLALAAIVRQRPDLKYGWIAYLFVAFIMACGTTHLFSILTLWVPAYGVEGLVKLVTAILSIATAGILWPLIPKLVALPSTVQLEGLNAQLRDSEALVRQTNIELEQRVAERTAELTAVVEERTAALAQRDLLLREVYHRVKNNLQMIDSLIVLQSRKLSDPAAKLALLSLRGRVHALGLVHNQLMGSEDLKTFDIAPFLQELSTNLVEGGPGREINLAVRAAPLDVGLDFAIPLGLLVTELVTNSLKHAFPTGKGDIEVALDRGDDGSVVLVVSDNGKGYDNVDPVSGGSTAALGTSIIEGLVTQLRGSVVVHRDNGTRSEIRIAAPVLS